MDLQVGDKVLYVIKKNENYYFGKIISLTQKYIGIELCSPHKKKVSLPRERFQREKPEDDYYIEKYTPGEPEPESCSEDTPECNIKKIEQDIKVRKEELKGLNKERRECLSSTIEYKDNITLKGLEELIKKKGIDNVYSFLDLFALSQDISKGIKMTRNHVFEALWILVYLYKLDSLNDTRNRQFYKSIEEQRSQTYEDVLQGNVNSGNDGGISDIYFEMDEGGIPDISDKTSCNGIDIPYPHCETKPIKVYNRYLFSSKLYSKTKGVGSYDIQDIYIEANHKFKDYNIVLLVRNANELQDKLDRTNKILGKRVHKILDLSDLDILYKKLLYHLQNKPDEINKLSLKIKPRFHQQYFIDYTSECIPRSNKFIWGAVPRSGKSFMIGGLVAEEQPTYVFLILGAITETKDQFIKMFLDYKSDFSDYMIHDLQNSVTYNGGKEKHIYVCSQEKVRMQRNIFKILKEEKDKIIFFDEIHQGSGELSQQTDMLKEVVFDNPFKAFIMVTATFAKPYLKYMNMGEGETKLIQWRYDDIQLMKDIYKKVIDDETGEEELTTYSKIKENILDEDDGILKMKIFNKLLKQNEKQGISLKHLAEQYAIYPNLIVSTPIITDIQSDYGDIIINGNIDIEKIFKPLMKKTPSDTDTCDKFIDYIYKDIYEKYIIQRLNKGHILRKPHSELWFLPTILRNQKTGEEEMVNEKNVKGKISPFSYLTKNFVTQLMKHPIFKEKYCFIILHSVGFENTKIEFINIPREGGKVITWNDAEVKDTAKQGCVSTICPSSKIGVKECIMEQEACAKAHGKSVIILTGKMMRLGVSLPCVDIALHMDPIKSVDTIYQSMFRVLTERKGPPKKDVGIFVDLLTSRQIAFMYEYIDYVSTSNKVFSSDKKMKKLLEKLLLFNFNGIDNTSGSEYQHLYNKLMEQFSLNDLSRFKQNTQKIDLSNVNEMLHDFDSKLIEDFYGLLENLNISYSEKKKKKEKKELIKRDGNEIQDDYTDIEALNKGPIVKAPVDRDLKHKYDEVSNFINDIIMLFSMFSTDNYQTIKDTLEYREKIRKDMFIFFKTNIKDIINYCESSELNDYSIIDCHLLNILKKDNSDYHNLKHSLAEIFIEILKKDDFLKIYYTNIEDMKKIKSKILINKKEKPCSIGFIKDDGVLNIIRNRLTVREEEKNLYGEVFTPIELICEMFSHIPDEVWKNPNLKWLDPANGIGNFPVIAYYKLMESLKGYKPKGKSLSKYIIEDMLYMVELNPVNVRVCKKIFKMIDPSATPNIVKHDFLTFDSKKKFGIEKFDVIMGNPPFQDKGGKSGKGGHDLYPIFFNDCVNKFLNDNGYILFITGNKWRAPDKKGDLKTMWDIFQIMNTKVLRIYSKEKTGELFNVAARVDYYLVQKSSKYNGTDVIDEKDEKHKIDIKKWDFLPNYNYTEIEKLVTSEGNGIKIIYSASLYEGSARNKNINKSKNSNFKYPVRHSHTIKDGEVIYWTNEKKGHFGIPKVILIKGTYIYPLNDYKGEYGMTNYSFGIPIKSNKEGELMVKALNSEGFKEIIRATKWQSGFTDHNMFKYFKPDFYKYFLSKSKSPQLIEKEPSKLKLELKPGVSSEVLIDSLGAPRNKKKTIKKPKSLKKPKSPMKQKSNCTSKKHPQGPPCLKGMYPKPPKNCCYKDKKTIKKGGARYSRRKKKRTVNKIKRTLRKKTTRKINRRSRRTRRS